MVAYMIDKFITVSLWHFQETYWEICLKGKALYLVPNGNSKLTSQYREKKKSTRRFLPCNHAAASSKSILKVIPLGWFFFAAAAVGDVRHVTLKVERLSWRISLPWQFVVFHLDPVFVAATVFVRLWSWLNPVHVSLHLFCFKELILQIPGWRWNLVVKRGLKLPNHFKILDT